MNRILSLAKQWGGKISRLWKPLSSSVRGADLTQMRLQNPVKSVGMKMFIPVFLSIVLLVGVLGFVSYSRANSIIQAKVSTSSEQTVNQVTDKLELIMKNYEDLTMQLLTDNDFSKLLVSYKEAKTSSYERLQMFQSISQKLNTFTTGKNGIMAVSLIPTAQGDKVISAGSVGSGSDDYTKTEWFQTISKGDGSAVWLPSQPKGYVGSSLEPTLALGRVLKNLNTGTKDFILLFEIRTKTISDVLNIKMGDTGITFILSPENKFVALSIPDAPLDAQALVQLSQEQRDTGVEHAVTENLTINKKNSLVIYKTIKTSGWPVVSIVPISELIKETGQIRNLTFLLIGIGILVAIGVGYFMARMIGGPLSTMRNLMKEGAQGNLMVRMRHDSQDEIGQLGTSFNVMMEQITVLVRHTNESAAMVQQTAGELLSASKQTASSAREIAVATEEIANGATSLATEAEKGNSLTNEIGDQMMQVVEANTQMGESASMVQKASEQGTLYMVELTAKTNTTEEMTRSMVEKVDRLKESTSSIRKILEVLNNMTKQTNILSLNATIEAARAGAAGKGFMVVADEIRRLAEQSKQNIEVVATITETIQKEIDETVAVLSNAYPVFQEQIQSVKETELIFKQVQSNMGGFISQLNGVSASIQELEQSQVVLNEAMTNVSAVSEESSATSEEVASLSNEQLNISDGLVKLSESLEQLSLSLQTSLSKFKV